MICRREFRQFNSPIELSGFTVAIFDVSLIKENIFSFGTWISLVRLAYNLFDLRKPSFTRTFERSSVAF